MTFSPLHPLGLIGVLAAAGALLVSSPGLAASAAPAEAASVAYVALGDSYAAGLGLTPLTGEPVPGCGQSEQNYPHRVAADLDLDLVDVSCSSASILNVSEEAQVTRDGLAAVQTDALTEDTDLVTVTVGGIDTGFLELSRACFAFAAEGPVVGDGQPVPSATCREFLVRDGVDVYAERIDQRVNDYLKAAYDAIRVTAPNAEVVVVGYPAIFPDAPNTPEDGCFTSAFGEQGVTANSVPYTATDITYLHGLEDRLNDTVAARAADAGFTFVDNLTPTLAHSVCSDDPYTNGVTLASIESGPTPGSLHPNEKGVAFLSSQVSGVVQVLFAQPTPEIKPAADTPTVITKKLPDTGFNGTTAFLVAGGLILAAAAIFIVRGVLAKRRRASSVEQTSSGE